MDQATSSNDGTTHGTAPSHSHCGDDLRFPHVRERVTVVADPRYEEYTFLNGLGRLVQRARINDRPTHVDLSAEPGGVYLLTLVGAGQVDRSRLIREWLLYEGAGARMPIAEDPCSDTT